MIAGGASVALLTGSLLSTLVPAAMSAFGQVVAGVGTLHASAAAGGLAAMLQATSAWLISAKGVFVGALMGGALAGIFKRQ